jgi:hypothetical protein
MFVSNLLHGSRSETQQLFLVEIFIDYIYMEYGYGERRERIKWMWQLLFLQLSSKTLCETVAQNKDCTPADTTLTLQGDYNQMIQSALKLTLVQDSVDESLDGHCTKWHAER